MSLPSAKEPQYWLYYEHENAGEWMSQLLISLVEHDGASYVVVESYGWRVSNPQEHAHRKSIAGDYGLLR